MYLCKKDFETYGFTDGCASCRDIASGKQRKGNFLAPHTVACRRKMEEAIKVAEPDRWERYILRRHQEEAAEERTVQAEVPQEPTPPAVADGGASPQASNGNDDEAEDLFRDLDEDGPDGLDADVARSPSACAALASQQLKGKDSYACEGLSRSSCVVCP